LEHYFDELLKKNKDIQDKIQYLGFIESKKSLYEYYKKAKIVALPSRWEGFSLVTTESSIFGDVILGSDIPSITDITNDGKFGYLCPIDDVECFTKTLRYMLSHENELKEKSVLIAEFVKKEFNWNKICSDLQKIILNKFLEMNLPILNVLNVAAYKLLRFQKTLENIILQTIIHLIIYHLKMKMIV